MIKFSKVTKSFDDNPVLKGITADIAEGQHVALIGPSGSGKSTLLKITMGLLPVDSGHTAIDGNRMTPKTSRELRSKIGYVTQNGGLFPHLSCLENVTLLPEYLSWSQERISQRIEELSGLIRVSNEWLSRKPQELSGGQAQRISLLRALMIDPPILILDEPLGSLDPMIRYRLQEDLKGIFRSLQKTVLLVTHDLPEASFLCERILLMKEGQIVQDGSIQQLRDHPENTFVSEFVSAQRDLSAL